MKQIDAKTQENDSRVLLLIAIIFTVALLLVFFLWYRHKKKKLELDIALEKERLLHQKELKERELHEQRLHKMIELAADGKLPKEVQEEVFLSVTYKRSTDTITYKGNE